jgi:opacity protein-like surface antigen
MIHFSANTKNYFLIQYCLNILNIYLFLRRTKEKYFMAIKNAFKISGCLLFLTTLGSYAFEVIIPNTDIESSGEALAQHHFYIGIQQGIINNVLRSSGEIASKYPDQAILPATNDPHGTELGFLMELVIGGLWDAGLDDAIGIEVNEGINTGAIKTSGPMDDSEKPATAFVVQRIKYDYGASVLLGHYLSSTHRALGYVRAGWTRALISSAPETSAGGLAGSDQSFNQWDNGLRLGIGLINQITNHISWRSEVGYTRYHTVAQKSSSDYFSIDPSKGETETAIWTYKPYQFTVTTGIVYNF